MSERGLRGTVAKVIMDDRPTGTYVVALEPSDSPQFYAGAWLEEGSTPQYSVYWRWRFEHHAVPVESLPEWAQIQYYEALLGG